MKIASKLGRRNANILSERPVTIVCLGDSVTHGCFELIRGRVGSIDTTFRPDEGYPTLLERKLRLLYPAAAASVINAGISGDSAQGGLKRLARDVLDFKPDLVTVNFGLNDSTAPDVEAGLLEYQSAMREIFERILDAGAEAMLVTPNMMCEYESDAIESESLRAFARRIAQSQKDGVQARYVDTAREIAATLNIPVADAFLRWTRLAASGADVTSLLSNHINHPVAALHELFATLIVDAMLA